MLNYKNNAKFISQETDALDFKDVYIVPQYTSVCSRSKVDTSLTIRNEIIDIPVISANMDTVTDGSMAAAMSRAGAIGAIHRFMSIEDNVEHFMLAKESLGVSFVSVGVNEESKDRATALWNAGARYFIIDIAHGHSEMMFNMIDWMRVKFGQSVFIMAGNVATPEATKDLINWGVNAIKIGIGPGAVCTTKNITGVTVPQFSAIMDCSRVIENHNRARTNPIFAVADGGVSEIGDIAKALGAGAHMVMCGRLFASANEAPGPRVYGKKVYRGMASKDAMISKNEQILGVQTGLVEDVALPTPEGISTLLDEREMPVAEILKNIKGGLQSSFSYSNSLCLNDFRNNCKFGIRHTSMR